MSDDLLTGAREQAERSDPPVRAAALLRIARVETAFDSGQAPESASASTMFGETLVQIMLDHGHVDAAIAYAMRCGEPSEFLFGMVPMLTQHIGDDTAKLALLRRAIEAWRDDGGGHSGLRSDVP